MEINVDEISVRQLDMSTNGYGVFFIVQEFIKQDTEITDEVFSWIVNPPPFYASLETDNIRKSQIEHQQEYLKNKESSLKLVKILKNEFYSFFCTKSRYYQKERNAIGGNINVVITGIAAAIATKLGNIEIGVVTSFVASFMFVLGKMGKKAMCEYLKPTS